MFIHSFGAYFGVAMAFVLGYKGANPEPKNHNESNKTSDTVRPRQGCMIALGVWALCVDALWWLSSSLAF